MNKIVLAFCLLWLSSSLSANQMMAMEKQFKISKNVYQLVKDISAHNIYEYRTIGISGTLSEQYRRFEKLDSIATNDELIYISRLNKNAVVRLYAYQALKGKADPIPKEIREQFNNDQSELQTLNGCLGTVSKVAQLSEEKIQNLSSLPPFDTKLK